MSWAEVSTVNGDFLNAPLDLKMHLEDYKLYGEDSYVFQQKELLHGLYECTYLSMNDKELSTEALDYLLENNKNIGEALSNVYGIERKDILSTLSTMQAVAASSTAMQAVANSSTAMSAVINSSTAMSAVANSSTAMSAVLNSPNCMYLGDTNLPNCKGAPCDGKFLLVGSPYDKYCVDNCTPNYVSQLNSGYKLIIQSSKFGRVYTKIGVAGIPVNTIFTMLDDYGSGNACIVYKL